MSDLDGEGAPGGRDAVRKLGRVQGASVTPGGARPICDVAKAARARNSPAAPGLEGQCRAHLAALAVEVAPIDPTGNRPHPADDEQGTSIPIIPPAAPEAPPTELPPPGRSHGVKVAGGVRYNYPHIRDRFGDFGLLDWCLESSGDCGQPAADAICQRVEHGKRPYASTISKFVDAGRFRETVIISSRDTCTDKTCNAFVSIVCTKK